MTCVIMIGNFAFYESICKGSRDNVVSIEIGCGLDIQGVGVRVNVESRIFSSPRFPDRLWGPPNLLSSGYRGAEWQKREGDHSLSATTGGQVNVDLYIHFPIRLHGVMLN
jgi:hypothetical protein